MVEVYHGKAGADSSGENQTGKSDTKESFYLFDFLADPTMCTIMCCMYIHVSALAGCPVMEVTVVVF